MASFSKLVSLENPVFCGYMTYGSVLVLKMMFMSLLTAHQRKKHKVPRSPEDVVFVKDAKYGVAHEDVERVRRAHLNDLENIPIFFIAGFAYILTDPDEQTALNLLRAVAISRCLHTIVYAIYVVPQPARALTWSVGYCTTGYMAARAICHFKTF